MMMILSWFVLFYAVWCFVVGRKEGGGGSG